MGPYSQYIFFFRYKFLLLDKNQKPLVQSQLNLYSNNRDKRKSKSP